MKPFETYYAKDNVVMKSRAKKYYNACKIAAIGLLQEEYKQAKGGKKVTIKEMIEVLKREL